MEWPHGVFGAGRGRSPRFAPVSQATMDLDERLVMLVSNYPELFDPTSTNYSNLERKERCWEEIALELGEGYSAGIPGRGSLAGLLSPAAAAAWLGGWAPQYADKAAKQRWLALRHMYRRAMRKKRESRHAAVKMRKWRLEDQMAFLEFHEQEADEHESVSTLLHPLDLDSLGESLDSAASSAGSPRPPTSTTPVAASQSSAVAATSSCGPGAGRRGPGGAGRGRGGPGGPGGGQSLAGMLQGVLAVSEQTAADPLLHFFLSMGKAVRTFPPPLQAAVKARVFQVVNEAELSLLVEASAGGHLTGPHPAHLTAPHPAHQTHHPGPPPPPHH